MNEKEARKRLKAIEKQIWWLNEKRAGYLTLKDAIDRRKESKQRRDSVPVLVRVLFLLFIASLIYLMIFYLPPLPAERTETERILVFGILFFSLLISTLIPDKGPSYESILKDIYCAIIRLEREREHIHEEFPDVISPVTTKDFRNRRPKLLTIKFLVTYGLGGLVFLMIKKLRPVYSAIIIVIYFFIVMVFFIVYRQFVVNHIKKLCKNEITGKERG